MVTRSSDQPARALRENRSLRVGVDARALAERPCGIRRYLENLLPADLLRLLLLYFGLSLSLNLVFSYFRGREELQVEGVVGGLSKLLGPVLLFGLVALGVGAPDPGPWLPALALVGVGIGGWLLLVAFYPGRLRTMVAVLRAAVLPVFLGYLFTQVLIAKDLQGRYLIIATAGLTLNVVLNALLIPHFLGVGAAAATATVATELMITVAAAAAALRAGTDAGSNR